MDGQALCPSPVDVVGLCDVNSIGFSLDAVANDRNFTEICIPEVLVLPSQKPDIEDIDKIIISSRIISKRLIRTPAYGVNAEGTCLTGYKLVIEGILNETVIYTARVREQTVHAAHFSTPFSTFIVMNKELIEELKTAGDPLAYLDIDVCIENVLVKRLGPRMIFKTVTLFLRAKKAGELDRSSNGRG